MARGSRLAKWLRGERGAVSPMLALLVVPLIGVMALAVEVNYWGTAQRTLQHAADSAALAAAQNGVKTVPAGATEESYKLEAKAAARKYNLGSSAVIDASNPDCPGAASGTNGCWVVSITRTVPAYLSRIVGYGSGSQVIKATAYAAKASTTKYCVVALGEDSKGNGITLDGGNTNWGECYARANKGTKCTSNDFKLTVAPAKDSKCDPVSDADSGYTDPYSSRKFGDSIPSKGSVDCISSSKTISTLVAGDWKLVNGTNFIRVCSGSSLSNFSTLDSKTYGSGTTISMTSSCPGNCAVIFDNVTLNLGNRNYNVSISGPAIFTNSGGSNIPTWIDDNTGTLSTVAPSSGVFDSMSMLDDPLKSASDYDAKKANLNLSGVMYAPNRGVKLNGSVDTSVSLQYCAAFVTKYLYSNGGKLFPLTSTDPTASCVSSGYELPDTAPTRAMLVL